MKPSLLILAAGIGSRYGGLKQLDGLGPSGETIMEYSIYDALKAGFGKIVLVIRKEFQEEFEKRLAPIKNRTELVFSFQEVNPKFDRIQNIALREKPWGTVHAVLTAMEIIKEPFAVINADDFYGRQSFSQMSDFLKNGCSENHWSMVGFQLGNTLSTHGGVSRGVCTVKGNDQLKGIKECKGIKRSGEKVSYFEGVNEVFLDENSKVSMNFWGLHHHFFSVAEEVLKQFILQNTDNPQSEMVIPDIIQPLLDRGNLNVSVLVTNEKWFGVTHKEDREYVVKQLNDLIKANVYPKRLWQ